jgi:hypothetical protein
MLQQTQKITVDLPIGLLHEAQLITGQGIAETLKIALIQLTRATVYQDLRKMRGKIEFSLDLKELRSD